MKRDRSQALVIRDNKILLVKHKMRGRVFYCLPGGGVEDGETPEMAAVRELQEESGVVGEVDRLISVQYKENGKGEVYTYLMRADKNSKESIGKDPELSEDEQTIVGVQWLSIEEIGEVDKAYLWAAGLHRIEYFHKYLLQQENKIYK